MSVRVEKKIMELGRTCVRSIDAVGGSFKSRIGREMFFFLEEGDERNW